MEDLEHKVLCSSAVIPHLYLHYVDDILIVWDQERGPHEQFLTELNAQHPQIQLTCELERNSVLPFLDISITRTESKAEIAVYRKATHSFHYMHYQSAQPPYMKKELLEVWFLERKGFVKTSQRCLKRKFKF